MASSTEKDSDDDARAAQGKKRKREGKKPAEITKNEWDVMMENVSY
jgi:hypothetical protein